MIETIISNNCVGGAVLHKLGMEFKTPTINLQILPEDFATFCWNLKYYMKQELKEVKKEDLGLRDGACLKKMFGGIPDMPFGMVGDILVCFQHYETFAEAKAKWDERKAKIDYEHVGYIMHARGPEYAIEAAEFIELYKPHSLCITEGFALDGAIKLDLPEGLNGFSAIDGELAIIKAADFKTWRENAC